MYKKRLKNSSGFVPYSGVGAHTLSAATILDADGGEAAKLLQVWTSSHENAYVHTSGFDAFCGTSPAHDSPQRAEWIDDEVYTHNDGFRSSSFGTAFSSAQYAYVPTFASSEGLEESGYALNGLIHTLPDELICQIFRFLPAPRDRSVCASVSKRWLFLQSRMRRNEFICSCAKESMEEEAGDEVQSREITTHGVRKVHDDDKRVERQSQWALGDLSRCLEGRKASDTRLAAVAVGTGARGGLGKLSIRRSMATDIGLSAIGSCCAALKSLCLWDCPNIKDEGLSLIGKGCGLLEKVDLFRCPLVGDSGLQSIAKSCSLLSFLNLDECGSITDKALVAVGQGCLNLLTLSIRNCARIGDGGIISAICNLKRLKRMKLDGLKVGDKTMACIGLYAKTLVRLSLANLDLVSEGGFTLLGLAQGMHSLQRFSLTSCKNFTDSTFAIIGKMWQGLKHLSLAKCDRVSDQGIALFMQNSASLEVLQLEMCSSITGKGLIPVFASQNGKLREVHVKKCDGIQEVGVFSPSHFSNVSSVKSISITQCPSADNMLLALIGCLCPQVTKIDFSGLTGINDEGILAFLYSGRRQLSSVNLSGCTELSDRVVCAIAEQCGDSLKSFYLDGCRKITDKGLKHMAKHCVVLEDLDVSQCSGITDKGVSPLISEMGVTLSSLNVSGCGCITNKILPLLVEYCQSLSDLNLKHCQGLSQKSIRNLESRLWKCTVLSV